MTDEKHSAASHAAQEANVQAIVWRFFSDIAARFGVVMPSEDRLAWEGLINEAIDFHAAARSLSSARYAGSSLTADAVEWVVNDIGELGVKVGNRFFFLYKGSSLEYPEGHDNGSPMRWRHVYKREFGECCHPDLYYKLGSDAWRTHHADDWEGEVPRTAASQHAAAPSTEGDPADDGQWAVTDLGRTRHYARVLTRLEEEGGPLSPAASGSTGPSAADIIGSVVIPCLADMSATLCEEADTTAPDIAAAVALIGRAMRHLAVYRGGREVRNG